MFEIGYKPRGRPRLFAKPTYTTTVRVDVKKYEWARRRALKDKRFALSKILNDAIEILMAKEAEATDPTPEQIAQWVKDPKL